MSEKIQKGDLGEPTASMGHGPAVVLTVVAAALNSAGGIIVRNLESATEWQVVFWRCATLAAAITGIVLARHRHALRAQLRRIGPWSLLGGAFYGVTLIGYVLALTNTTVANADFTMSSIPVFTALFAWIALRERAHMRTILAIMASIVGIGLMVGDGIAEGTVLGNAMAILAAMSFACFVVVLRKANAIDMLPTAAVGAILAAIAAAIMTGGEVSVSGQDFVLCLVWGAVLSCAAHFLIVTTSRALPGAELTLLLLIEFILGPAWVWLFIDEQPSVTTLAGGAIVLTAVAGYAAASMRRGTPPIGRR
jgi:drug/metabolite transporter (DMT)-like permease